MSEEKERIAKLEEEIELLKEKIGKTELKKPLDKSSSYSDAYDRLAGVSQSGSSSGSVALVISIIAIVLIGIIIVPPFLQSYQETQDQRRTDLYMAKRECYIKYGNKPLREEEYSSCIKAAEEKYASGIEFIIIGLALPCLVILKRFREKY